MKRYRNEFYLRCGARVARARLDKPRVVRAEPSISFPHGNFIVHDRDLFSNNDDDDDEGRKISGARARARVHPEQTGTDFILATPHLGADPLSPLICERTNVRAGARDPPRHRYRRGRRSAGYTKDSRDVSIKFPWKRSRGPICRLPESLASHGDCKMHRRGHASCRVTPPE